MSVECPKCKKKFKNEKILRQHLKKKIPCDRKLICPNCNKIFTCVRNYKNHMNRKNPCIPLDLKLYENIVDPDRTCLYCHKKFKYKYTRNRHYKICKVKNVDIKVLLKNQNGEMKELKKELNDLKEKFNELKTNMVKKTIKLTDHGSSESNDKITEYFTNNYNKIINTPLNDNKPNYINIIALLVEKSYKNEQLPETKNIFIDNKHTLHTYINSNWEKEEWNLEKMNNLLSKLKILIKYGVMVDNKADKHNIIDKICFTEEEQKSLFVKITHVLLI